MERLSKDEFLKRIPKNRDYDVIGEYLGNKYKIVVKTKHGLCSVEANSLIKGIKPSVRSALNQRDYFISEVKEVHGNKYTYGKLLYTKDSEKIVVTCSIHGDFSLTARSHKQGTGCRKCFNETQEFGYHKSDFINKANNKAILYVLRCWNDEEEFYKVGITSLEVKVRFKDKLRMPYTYEVVKVIKSKDAGYIWDLEKRIHRMVSKFAYSPKIKFNGSKKECFKFN